MPDRPSEPTGDSGTGTPGPSRGADSGRRFVFIDTETTGLDFSRHQLTEVAWIVRFEDGRQEEHCVVPEHTLDGADPTALELTHYHELIAPRPRVPASDWLVRFLDHADGAVLVGAVPDFDARHLEQAAARIQLRPTWDHHLLDVETLALPLIAPGPEAPRSLARTCRALGIPHDQDQAHGALYDARQAMRVFDRVHEVLAELRSTGAPLPPPVVRNGTGAAQRPSTPATGEPPPPGQSTSDQTS